MYKQEDLSLDHAHEKHWARPHVPVDAGARHGGRDGRVSRGLLAASLAENGEL